MVKLDKLRLDKMSLKELMAFEQDLRQAIKRKKPEAIASARDEMNAVAKKYGLATVEILTPNGRTRRTGGRPKWRDPVTGATWTGQGRPPKWKDRAVAI